MNKQELKAKMIETLHGHFGFDPDQRFDSVLMVEFIDQLIALHIQDFLGGNTNGEVQHR